MTSATPSPAPPAIRCVDLTKAYGRRRVVEGLSFELPAGSLCAFLGPNGSGKSTTLGLLTGLLPPTSGGAWVDGLDVVREALPLKRRVGVVPERLGLFDHLTVEEHFHLAGPLYGLDRAETRRRTEELLHALGLERARDRFADECSHGMRKKTALGLALIHNPSVLFLDEPFEGIDPAATRAIHDLLEALAERGMTVFFTSHALTLVERLATHAMVIRDGRLAWTLAPGETASLEEIYFDLVEAPRPTDLPWLRSPR